MLRSNSSKGFSLFLVLSAGDAGANLLTNPGFESGLANWTGSATTAIVGGYAGSRAARIGPATGGISQVVSTAPTVGATYSLSGAGRVGTAGKSGYVGVHLLDASGKVLKEFSLAFASATYEKKSLNFVPPAGTAKLRVYTWKGTLPASFDADEIVLVKAGATPSPTPSPTPPPATPGNLVANPGFESGTASWDTGSRNTTIGANAASGTQAARIGTASGGISQTLSHAPAIGATYVLSGSGKVTAAGERGWIGVHMLTAAGAIAKDVSIEYAATTYQKKTLNVVPIAGTAKLRVYTWKGAGAAHFDADDVGLVKSGATPAPSPTPSASPTSAPTSPPSSANLILETTFENASALSPWILEVCRSNAITISANYARKGGASARFEFTKNDVIQYNKYVRAEIRQASPPEKEYWYAFSNYLPNDFVADPLAEKIAQWHEVPDWDLGEGWRSPPIALGIENDRYFVNIMWSADRVNTNDSAQQKRFDLGPVDRNRWNDWAFRIKFSHGSDGILEVYKNKVRVIAHYGPNSFNDVFTPYFKLGIYKWGWNGWAEYSPEDRRVLYVDEIRIGNRRATLDEVSPR